MFDFYVENTDEYARQVNCTRKFFHTMPKKPTGHFAHTLVKMYDFIEDNRTVRSYLLKMNKRIVILYISLMTIYNFYADNTDKYNQFQF